MQIISLSTAVVKNSNFAFDLCVLRSDIQTKKFQKTPTKKFRNSSKTTHYSIENSPVISGREKSYIRTKSVILVDENAEKSQTLISNLI